MTTTIMRDSVVGDAWIQQTMAQVPIQWVLDGGERTGDIMTGPVRLAFETLFELPQPSEKTPNPKYGASLLFPPGADFSPMYEAYNATAAAHFADHYDAASQQYFGLHSPFRDQGEKMKFGAFTPGCVFITATSKFKPGVVDLRGNPVIDPAKAYPGVWAICGLNCYHFNDPRKKGVGFGLQSVMLIGDDTRVGGGAPDPNKTFGSVQAALTPPPVSAGQGAALPPGGMPPGAPAMPPGAPAMPPGAPAMPPGAPAMPPGAPAMPPGAPAMPPTMPGAPLDPRGPVPDGFSTWVEYDELMG